MKKLIINGLGMLVAVLAFSQEGWNWPEDEQLKSQAVEKQAYYKLLIAQEEHSKALKELNWLYENNPELHQSIYIEGVNCLEEVMKGVDDKPRQMQIKDSILWMFDQRIAYFDNDGSTMDRKAYQAFLSMVLPSLSK